METDIRKPRKKIEDRKTYTFFLEVYHDLLKEGFTKYQAFAIMRLIHKTIDAWKGYHYRHIAQTADQSLDYLIKQEIEKDTSLQVV